MLNKTPQIMAPTPYFDRAKSPCIQRYLSNSGHLGVVLSHDSVGPEYIAMWLSARIEEAQGTSHSKTVENRFTEMLRTLDSIYPPRTPAKEV